MSGPLDEENNQNNENEEHEHLPAAGEGEQPFDLSASADEFGEDSPTWGAADPDFDRMLRDHFFKPSNLELFRVARTVPEIFPAIEAAAAAKAESKWFETR